MSRSRRRPAPPSAPISEGRHPLLDPPPEGEEERHHLMPRQCKLRDLPPHPTPQVLPMFPVQSVTYVPGCTAEGG